MIPAAVSAVKHGTVVKHGNEKVAMVIGLERPPIGVLYDAECDRGHDSGFTVLMGDAPPQADLHVANGTYDDPRVTPWCLHCQIEEYPEVGRGLDIAIDCGESHYDADDEEWLAVIDAELTYY